MFNLHCSMTENDYYNFNLVFQKLPSNRKNMLRGMFIVPAAWFFVFMLYGLVSYKGFNLNYSVYGGIIFLVLSVIWILLYKPLIRLTLKSNIKKMKKMGRLPYNPESDTVFENESFTEEGSGYKCEVKYSEIERIVVAENGYICLFTDVQRAHIFKFDCFKDEAERKDFIDFIKEKTGKEVIYLK